jgi:nitrogen fixation-related uncharacterized protein
MNTTPQQIINDLISSPGLGMFAWMCVVFFIFAFLIFLWAFKSGQMDNIEDIKFDMLQDNNIKDKGVTNVR